MTPELAKLTQEVMDLACRVTALEYRIAQLQPKAKYLKTDLLRLESHGGSC